MSSLDKHTQASEPLLAELAGSYGVLPSYRDSRGGWRESSTRSIYQALAALGADVDFEDAGDSGGIGMSPRRRRLERAIGARRGEIWSRMLEPVLVFWDGVPDSIVLRLLPGEQDELELTLALEDGTALVWRLRAESLLKTGEERVAGYDYAAWRLPRTLGVARRLGRVPPGYHRLRVSSRNRQAEATVISAPRRCWSPAGDPPRVAGRPWGVFAPLYGMHSERDWGAGDLADLEQLRQWVGEAGGLAVATLPLLAAYLDKPFEPAPYRPVSRLFWNEFYLGVDRIAEWGECRPARDLWQSAPVHERVAALRAAPAVDYAGVMAVKRQVLERLSDCFFGRAGVARHQSFLDYLATHPYAEEYAAFRAEAEAAGEDWRRRPPAGPARAPRRPDDISPAERYHLYCQWQMDEQLARSHDVPSAQGSETEAGLFLDVPVGVHPGGFDTWKWRGAFVQSLSTGAPPDAFFALGQNWDTPPPHPGRMREQGHQYLVSYLREHMRHAPYLRIDHFMSLHRLFCVPEGNEPKDGVYVAYPAEEQYAVLALESHRQQTVVVGEDLGTIPPEVRRSMRRHGVLGTWVLQMSLRPRAGELVSGPGANVIAAVNTHDTFPFAGFLRGDDIAARVETGQLDGSGARREIAARRRLVTRLAAWRPECRSPGGRDAGQGAPVSVAAAGAAGSEDGLLLRALRFLAQSRAALVLVNLEDLWGETRPQNQPGTGPERGNWQRRLAATQSEVREAIRRVAEAIAAGR